MSLRYSLDIARLSAAYEKHQLTPARVIDDLLELIGTSQQTNRAWIHVLPREVLVLRAAELERQRGNGEVLSLFGVPFAIKDNIDLSGQPTTAACPAFRYVARETAHAVQRLEKAGAMCIGKTNMDQFATGLVGTRSPYGACVNPFDSRYISGGSSSGSAVAVAMGQVSFALGTDTAGSGRVPAGYCNIVGLKPTRGLISMHGVLPACRSLDCMSVFALTVEDARGAFDVMTAFDETDSYSRPDTRTHALQRARIRCGVPRKADLRFFGDQQAERAFDRALETLVSLGADRVDIDYTPFHETARLLYEGPWVAERLLAIKNFYQTHASEIDPVVRQIIGGGAKFTAADAFKAQYRLQELTRECARAWSDMDMLVVPTVGTAYRTDEIAADPVGLNANLGYYTNFVNLLDLAALAVPGSFREDGLACGITLIAPALHDALLAGWASRFHRATATQLGATSFAPPQPLTQQDAVPAVSRGSSGAE